MLDTVKSEEVQSPVEELPLIPKGFLEQQKKLEDSRETDHNKCKSTHRKDELKEKTLKDSENQREVELKLKSFKHLTENQYLYKLRKKNP